MDRVDGLSCDECLHVEVKKFTGREPKHCAYCVRRNGGSRLWNPIPDELLNRLMDCYINLAESGLPTMIHRSPGPRSSIL